MIQIRHIRLRSTTADKTFGVDVPLRAGLNVIQADNSSGKSTTLMSIIYALGLERSIGPKLDVPLPYAMRERIRKDKDSNYETVLESHVAIELINQNGEILTVRRDIAGVEERKLVRTWDCPLAEVDLGLGTQRDFFLFDAGSASRIDGFHHRLAAFLGWELPQVPRFDGEEGLLYIETLFPMFFVEQKRGWSTIQGPLPTFLGIQDLPRRVMEFVLDLDAGKIRRRRSELRKELTLLGARYRDRRKELVEGKGAMIRIEGLPSEPTAAFGQSGDARLTVFFHDQWMPLDEASSLLQEKVDIFEGAELTTLEDMGEELRVELKKAEERYAELDTNLQVLRQDFQLGRSEKQAFEDRVAALETDLLRNRDALKLQNLGSTLGSASMLHQCPTCQQSVETELLPAESRNAMGLDENIIFIRSQLDLYRSMLGSSSDNLDIIGIRFQALREEIQEQRSHIRSLKSDLLRSTKTPARSELKEILRAETKVDRWKEQQEKLDGTIDDLRKVAQQWAQIRSELTNIGAGSLTPTDKAKVARFEELLQKLLERFHFSSFRARDITLSKDDFRPQVVSEDEDGELVHKDIGFESSASDGIRLKWSYELALLMLSRKFDMNHLGFVVFDEPGQQQMRELDLATFLAESAGGVEDGRQIIVTTSEVLERVRGALAEDDANIVPFDGYILKPLHIGT